MERKLVRRISLDALIYALAAYGLPVAIGVLTWIALAAWQPHYRAAGAVPLELRVMEDAGAALDPPRAAALLARRAPVPHHDTRLSEAPFWFAFAGSGLTLVVVWRQLDHIAHADEPVPAT